MTPNRLAVLLLCLIIIFAFSCHQTKFPFGERIFLSQCADCHMDDGQGLSALYPSLKTETIVARINELPCIIKNGLNDTSSLIQMLPMPHLSDVEITNVMNYILHDLNRSPHEVYLPEVQKLLRECTSEKE